MTDPTIRWTQEGNEININNAIPSVKGNLRSDYVNPTDMYYACLEPESGDTPHHWDENNNGVYLEYSGTTEWEHCSVTPVVAVSRMSMKPIMVDDRILNQHQLITNFLHKVNVAEADNFHGNFKIGLTSSSLDYRTYSLDNGLMQRNELYYFDRAPNMPAPEHPDSFCDVGPMIRRHASELIATRRPVIDAMSFHEPNTVSENATKSAFGSFFGAHDRELGAVDGHGWAGGTGQFNANLFSTCSGLIKINVVGISCETGYLDIYGNRDGKSVANLCLGEAGCANPTATGGVLASLNNTRVGWNGGHTGSYRGPDGLSAKLHYYMINGLLNGKTAGEAWLNMALSYLGGAGNHMKSTGGQCYTEEMLFGDPLIKLMPIENYTWSGGDGDWTYNNANEVTFNAAATVNVAKKDEGIPYGAMSLAINQNAGDTFKLTGDGGIKVMRGITVSNGNIEVGISGGIGGVGTYYENSESETAKRENYLKFTNAGAVTFNNTNPDASFFVNGIKNASAITFAGAGVVLNTDQFDNTLGTSALTFHGPDNFDPRTAPANVIRANLSKTRGAMAKFMPLTLTNSALTLETFDTFNGYNGDTFMTLNNSILTYRISRWRGLTDQDYLEKVHGTLYLNNSTLAADYPCSVYLNAPTIEVTGNSSIETTNGGKFKLEGTTTIDLKNSEATITINADFERINDGEIVIKGSGRVIVATAKSLIGRVRIEEGVTLELTELPLTEVPELELKTNTKIVLQHTESNFYQVIPLSSALVFADNADIKVYSKSGEVETFIPAELTQTGSIFESGTLLEWAEAEGVWSQDPNAKPWIKNRTRTAFSPTERAYFPDLKDSSGGAIAEATVNVAETIESPFTCFANKNTAYTFNRSSIGTAQDATITFDSLVIGGKTRFNLPTFYNTRLYVSAGGYFAGAEVTTPLIEVVKGGVLEAGSIGTTDTTPTEVNIEKGGTLVLTGESHSMNLNLEAGAKLKPMVESPLVWSELTHINWPEDKVIVDVSEWEITDEPIVIIRGVGADMDWISHLEPSANTASLAVKEGDVCLVRCDTCASPFTLTLNAQVTGWDTDNWYANGTKFAKKWSESYPNWLATGEITVNVNNAELDLEVGAHFNTLTFDTSLEEASVKLVLGDEAELTAREVHFDAFAKADITNLELGSGILYAAPETRIRGKWSGVLGATTNNRIYVYNPEEPFTFVDGFQGTIFVGVEDKTKTERQKILRLPEGESWPILGVDIVPIDPDTDEVVDDCYISFEDEWVYLVPPPPTAHAPAGESDWSKLTWCAYDGSPSTISDWNNIYSAKIISDSDEAVVVMDRAPTKLLMVGEGRKLTLKAKDGSATTMPRELEVDGEVTVQGAILPELDYIQGTGKLILDTGKVTELIIVGNAFPLDPDTQVEIKAGSTLSLAHIVDFIGSADLSKVTGDGALEIKDISGSVCCFALPEPSKMFSTSLSFVHNTILTLQSAYDSTPVNVGNLSGSGTFDFDDRSWTTRCLRTTQTKVTEWSGAIPQWSGAKSYDAAADFKLIVAGVDLASLDHRLIYSSIAGDDGNSNRGNDHDLEIESTGCLELNGYWNGNIINNGILVLGRHKLIKDKTIFQGSGRIGIVGDKLDLLQYPTFATKYPLASGSYGEIDFAVNEFDADQEIMSVENNFTLPTNRSIILVAENGGERKWQPVTSDNIQNGKLVWLKDAIQESSEIIFELASGDDNDFNTLIGDQFLGGAPKLTINGNADGTSYLDASEQIGLFKGTLSLNNATVKCVFPLESTLAANPTGKLVFVVDEALKDTEQVMIKLADGWTYDPQLFTVEVVGSDGRPTDAYWTWTTQNNELKYIIVDPRANKYMPRAYKFDGNLSNWGNKGGDLGNITSDNYEDTRDGKGVKPAARNLYGGGFEIGTDDWTITYVMKLSKTPKSIHFPLGNGTAGIALINVDDTHAGIGRWCDGHKKGEILVEGEVEGVTSRFNMYAITYRKGMYSLYVNGKLAGSAMDYEGAPAYGETINWQWNHVHGGGGAGFKADVTDSVFDDWRLYNVALSENTIQAIADEFPPWPDTVNAEGGEIWVDVNDAYVNLLIEGSGIIHLTHRKGEPNLAKIVGLSGDATIILEDGVELTVDMDKDNREPLSGHSVEVKNNARLILRQTGEMTADNQSLRGVDLSNITGEGTLELKSDDLKYSLKVGSSVANMSLCANTKIVLDSGYTESSPLVLNNLSGNGTFTFSGSGVAYLTIVQSKRSVFMGTFPAQARVQVVGVEDAPNGSAAFVLVPKAELPQNMTITTAESGVLAVASTNNLTKATITNNGLMVFEPDAETTIDIKDLKFDNQEVNRIALSGSGVLKVAAGASGFELQSNPMGTLQITGLNTSSAAQSIIKVSENWTYSPTAFHINVPNSSKKVTVLTEEGYLKVRLTSKQITILVR